LLFFIGSPWFYGILFYNVIVSWRRIFKVKITDTVIQLTDKKETLLNVNSEERV